MDSLPIEVLDIIFQFALHGGSSFNRDPLFISKFSLVNKHWQESVEYSDELPSLVAKTCFPFMTSFRRRGHKFTWAEVKNGVAQAKNLQPVPVDSLRAIEDCDSCESCPFYAESLHDINLQEKMNSRKKMPTKLTCKRCNKEVPIFNIESRAFAERPREVGKPWAPSNPEGKEGKSIRRPATQYTYASLVVDSDGKWASEVLRSMVHLARTKRLPQPLQNQYKEHCDEIHKFVDPGYQHSWNTEPDGRSISFNPFLYFGGSCAHMYELYPVTVSSRKELDVEIARVLPLITEHRLTYIFFQSKELKDKMGTTPAGRTASYSGKYALPSCPLSPPTLTPQPSPALMAVAQDICNKLESWCGSETSSFASDGSGSGDDEPVSDVDGCTDEVY